MCNLGPVVEEHLYQWKFCWCVFGFFFFLLFPMKTGCPLLISVAVKHKFKLMHPLMLFFKRTVYLNLGLRPFS